MFKDRDAATVRSEGLVCAETAERDSLVPRRPATEEAGAKASAPHASAATSRGLHMLALLFFSLPLFRRNLRGL